MSGTDYTVSGTTVTISKGYLAKQNTGTTTLTFDFSAGAASTLTVSITDTTPTQPSQPSVTGSLNVQMFNGTLSASSNTISPKIKLTNTGSTAINLSDVTIRYYYTIDKDVSQSFWCDWATVGSTNITGKFVKMATATSSADYYFEIGFNSSSGTLAAGASTEMQIRFAKTDWSNYTQTGDYSFDSTDTSYKDNSKTPAYISGTIQWGTEP